MIKNLSIQRLFPTIFHNSVVALAGSLGKCSTALTTELTCIPSSSFCTLKSVHILL